MNVNRATAVKAPASNNEMRLDPNNLIKQNKRQTTVNNSSRGAAND
jgi:hypothetical protein